MLIKYHSGHQNMLPTPNTKKSLVVTRILILVVYCLSATGCAADRKNTTATNPALSSYMLAEIALKRSQDERAYEYINQIVKAGANQDTYERLIKLLKARRHADFRYTLIQRWHRENPTSHEALTALAREQLCRDDKSSVATLSKLLHQKVGEPNLSDLTRCLSLEKTVQLVESMIAADDSLESLKQFRCYQLAKTEEISTAIQCYEALKSIPNLGAKQTLAGLYVQVGNAEKAKSLYQAILEREPGADNSRYELAGIYYDSGEYESAIEQLSIINARAPKNRNVQYLLAASYYSLKRFAESRHWFEQTLFSKQFRNRAFYYLGLIAIEMGEPDEALKYLSSVEASEEYLPAQLKFWRLIAEDDLETAINGLYDLLDELPEERMTIKLVQIDLYDQADEQLYATQELVSLADDYPNHLRLQILRVQWLIDQNYLDHIDANLMASLDGIVEVSQQIQLVKSTIYRLLEQHYGAEAIKILSMQNVITKDTEDYQYLLALANATAENYSEAIALLTDLLEKQPDRHDVKNALSFTLTMQGEDYKRAEALILAALEQRPDSAAYLDSLGWLRYREGKLDEAERLLNRANEISNDPAIKAHLIELYIRQDRTEDARALLAEALSSFPDNNALKKLDVRLSNYMVSMTDD